MRIIVVGGGVVALATAYRLAKAGCDVVVLEARTLGSAATHGNAAKIALAESGPVPAPGVILQGAEVDAQTRQPAVRAAFAGAELRQVHGVDGTPLQRP